MRARERTRNVEADATAPSNTGPGDPLDRDVREAVEVKLGHRFDDVRIHAGEDAARGARALGARAYALGQRIVFGRGEYAPRTVAGRRLLMHELIHVAQQRAGAVGSHPAITDEEREAETGVDVTMRGGFFTPRVAARPHVARQPLEEPGAATTLTELQPISDTPAVEAIERDFEQDVAGFKREQLDFTRDRITIASQAITREFTDMQAKPEHERPVYRTKITALERELTKALADSLPLLEKRIEELRERAAHGEDVQEELEAAEREFNQNSSDLATFAGAFPPEKGEAFERVYKGKLAGAACMERAYEGLGALHSPDKAAEIKKDVQAKAEAERTRTGTDIDHFITVMDTVNGARLAGPKMRARWSKAKRTWTPTLESLVRPNIRARGPAYYFFGLALAEAYHSVIVGVSTWGDTPVTLWCDQGGCERVEGTLDDFAREQAEAFEIPYGDWDTYVWQILPPAEASLVPPEGTK